MGREEKQKKSAIIMSLEYFYANMNNCYLKNFNILSLEGNIL